MTRALAILACVVAACGDPAPAPPDALPVPDVVTTDERGAMVTTLAFDAAYVDQPGAVKLLTLINRGTGPSPALTYSLTGTEARDFTIVGEQTTCSAAGLASGASCTFAIRFEPLAPTPRAAMLEIFGVARIALTGDGIAPLRFVPAALDFGGAQVNESVVRSITLQNPSPRAVRLAAMTTTLGFSIVSKTCGELLDADSDCTVTLAATPFVLGDTLGALDVRSHGTSTYRAPLTLRGTRIVRIVLDGPAADAGRVVSDPPGIDCPGTCEAVFATTVRLVPSIALPAVFESFAPVVPCDATGCTVPDGIAPAILRARFFAGPATNVMLEVTGEGAVLLELPDMSRRCTSSCAVPAHVGDLFSLQASTRGHFDGFSGCTAFPDVPALCEGVVTADMTIAAAFSATPP